MSQQAPAIERLALNLFEIHVLEAADVDGHRLEAVRRLSIAERCNTATLTEVVLDNVLVERVGT
jgi:hypothetical protein